MGFILFVAFVVYVAVHWHVFMDGRRKRARAVARPSAANDPVLLKHMDQLRLDIEAWVAGGSFCVIPTANSPAGTFSTAEAAAAANIAERFVDAHSHELAELIDAAEAA